MAHSYKIICSTTEDSTVDYVPSPEPPELANVVPDRVEDNVKSKYNAVCQNEESPFSLQEDDDGLQYLDGRYRFCDENDGKETICGVIENEVLNDAEWYVVKHHSCDHDKDDNVGCGDDVEICKKGDVPQRFL